MQKACPFGQAFFRVVFGGETLQSLLFHSFQHQNTHFIEQIQRNRDQD